MHLRERPLRHGKFPSKYLVRLLCGAIPCGRTGKDRGQSIGEFSTSSLIFRASLSAVNAMLAQESFPHGGAHEYFFSTPKSRRRNHSRGGFSVIGVLLCHSQ